MPTQTNYIASADYAAYGVPNATTVQVDQASNIVDAALGRTEGLLYATSTAGAPLYMLRKPAETSRTISANVNPGALVQVSITSGAILQQGTSLVLNKLGTTAEVCKIQQVIDANTVVLAFVANAHISGETAETGLTVEETVKLAKNRNFVVIRRNPIVKLVSVIGRVTYARRGDLAHQATMQDFSMIAAISAFGGAPIWQDVQVPDSSIDVQNGNIWCPIGLAMIPYNEVKLSYIAGYTYASLPMQIKQATANVMQAIAESPASAAIKTFKAGDTQMERFLSTIIDDETRALLSPFEVRRYG